MKDKFTGFGFVAFDSEAVLREVYYVTWVTHRAQKKKVDFSIQPWIKLKV
jgi:hypothetical protein